MSRQDIKSSLYHFAVHAQPTQKRQNVLPHIVYANVYKMFDLLIKVQWIPVNLITILQNKTKISTTGISD